MQEKDKGQQLEVLSYLSKGNQFVLYVFRKISKVSQAVYIVTDLVKDVEPIKWTLRKVASDMASFKYFLDEQRVFYDLERMLLELEGLLGFARNAKVLSDMNGAILLDQIKILVIEMRDAKSAGQFYKSIEPSFFDTEKPVYKGHNVLYDFYNQTATPKMSLKPTPAVSKLQHQFHSQDKGHRKDEMLKIIKAKGAVMIKDITELIKDCSEKTIQRELLSMVQAGILRKIGEKRWSRYTLA